ncbi:sugar phosphate isomerase/epimerase family protein [Mycolicibacterium neoaurum]|uniref:sugar phosphate isomerase/epimerase family protein n=1 Tax=Mycolicibacterium neoaurum TaxID=1795 RepID=UPI001F4D2713|nr:sugar phosphate isomerase/epimerase [Mycolicibacterium neoaurum]
MAAAGFDGFGLHYSDIPDAKRRYGWAGIRSLFQDSGIADIELEGIPRWWSDDLESRYVRHRVLRAAEVLGACHIKVTPDDLDEPWDKRMWQTRFAKLAAEAAGVGARLGLEFLPWSNIKNLRDGLDFVDGAGHDNGGVVLDIWHLERSQTPVDAILKLQRNRITSVELTDAPGDVVGSMHEDTVNRRLYCGEGSFNIAGFINALRAIQWDGPWGIEIMSADHRKTPLREALRSAYVAGYSQLASC